MLLLAMVSKAECSYDDLTALDALGVFNEQREIYEYPESNNFPLPHILQDELDWVCANAYDSLSGFLKGPDLEMRSARLPSLHSPCETAKMG
jgi:hypothetical protein